MIDGPLEAPLSMELDDGLYLRQLTSGDVPVVHSTVNEFRNDLREWLPWVDATGGVGDTFRFVESTLERRRAGEAFVYGLWCELDFSGVISLHNIDSANDAAQIGYWLKPPARGRGRVTMAAAALLGVAFELLGAERLEIRCGVGNEASARIPERLGFTLEGVMRHGQRIGGRYVDLKLYSLLESDYRSLLSPAETD